MKRKKSTGGLFLGADQFNKEALPLVTVSVTDVGVLAVLGTEWIFFGLPTEKEDGNRRSYNQYEVTGFKRRLRLIMKLKALEKLNIFICIIFT